MILESILLEDTAPETVDLRKQAGFFKRAASRLGSLTGVSQLRQSSALKKAGGDAARIKQLKSSGLKRLGATGAIAAGTAALGYGAYRHLKKKKQNKK